MAYGRAETVEEDAKRVRGRLTAIVAATVCLYASVIVVGSRLGPSYLPVAAPRSLAALQASKTDLVSQGEAIFNHTPDYAARYVGGTLSCTSCHAEGGRQAYASSMIGVAQRFPQFSKRAGRVITIQDRIRECFVRSENGKPLRDDTPEMRALVAYLVWLSPRGADASGKGLLRLPALKPDPVHGEQVYSTHCAGCHGANGAGNGQAFPALWGPDSFNDGAGMNRVNTFAEFVHHNMPQNRMGVLSPQDAYDVSAFVHQQSRPTMNSAYSHF